MLYLIMLNKFKLVSVILWKHLLPEFGEFYRKGNFTRAISFLHRLVSWQISHLEVGGASQNVKICKRFNIRDRWDPQFIPSCVYSPSASCSTFFRNSMRLGEIQIQHRDIRCNFPTKYVSFRNSATNSPRVCKLELTVSLQKNVQIIKFSVIDEPRHLSRSCLPPFLPTLANPNLIKQTKSPKKVPSLNSR